MRLEIRSSGGDVCEQCGSFDLVRIAYNGEGIVHDFGALVEEATRAREGALAAEFVAERAALLLAVGEELRDTRAAVEELRVELLGELQRPRGLRRLCAWVRHRLGRAEAAP